MQICANKRAFIRGMTLCVCSWVHPRGGDRHMVVHEAAPVRGKNLILLAGSLIQYQHRGILEDQPIAALESFRRQLILILGTPPVSTTRM